MAGRFSLEGKKIWVAGHRGMVGSAILRALSGRDATLLCVDRSEVDLTRQAAVESWVQTHRPDVVIVAAARVGGILANSTFPVEFLYENLMIASNVISASAEVGVSKLLYLGSTCIYPRLAQQPIVEDALLTGPLEPTNEAYALAKIAGIKLAQAHRTEFGRDFISAMPTNLYGPGDNFDLSAGHVLPALMWKIHEAKRTGAPSVTIWGSGTPRREFLHVDELARASTFLLENYSESQHVNVGTGEDVSISELAEMIRSVVGYEGKFDFDSSKPDGSPRKCTDISKLKSLGWSPSGTLRDGIRSTYEWFLNNREHIRGAPQPVRADHARPASH